MITIISLLIVTKAQSTALPLEYMGLAYPFARPLRLHIASVHGGWWVVGGWWWLFRHSTTFEYDITDHIGAPGASNLLAVRVASMGSNSRWYVAHAEIVCCDRVM